MARRCELSGKGVMSGNNVSHALNRTRRKFLPNLCNVTLMSETLGRNVKLKVSAAALRTVEHRGGLDAYLLKAKDTELSDRALGVKKKKFVWRKPLKSNSLTKKMRCRERLVVSRFLAFELVASVCCRSCHVT